MLTETRSKFVYEAARLAAIAAGAPVVPAPWAEREKIFREQFARVIGRQCGPQRSESPEELHGSWPQLAELQQLAAQACSQPDLPPDVGYEQQEADSDSR